MGSSVGGGLQAQCGADGSSGPCFLFSLGAPANVERAPRGSLSRLLRTQVARRTLATRSVQNDRPAAALSAASLASWAGMPHKGCTPSSPGHSRVVLLYGCACSQLVEVDVSRIPSETSVVPICHEWLHDAACGGERKQSLFPLTSTGRKQSLFPLTSTGCIARLSHRETP